MNRRALFTGIFGLVGWMLTSNATAAQPAAPFDLKEGDRVVLLGGTFIERDQSHGYFETLLSTRFPDRNVTFRNLGWSGDTVWGEARSRFGPQAEGFAHLKTHVEALKPTVIFVNYGLNESFAGKPGLPAFEKGLATLLDVLDKAGARVVLITPRKLENLGPPLPDPARANDRLKDYVDVLRAVASSRGYRVVDLFNDFPPTPGKPLTDNGVHLTDAGYRVAAEVMARSLGLEPAGAPVVRLNATGTVLDGTNARVEAIQPTSDGLSFRLPSGHHDLAVEGLSGGSYEIAIDGKPIASTDAQTLKTGVALDPSEPLRATIIAKNQLYFYRWRPQNETYLFGFRKHEQGNNAVEIPMFDPLVAAKEAEIAKLRVPASHVYTIKRKIEAK